MEKHKRLVLQAEDLATAARREVRGVQPSGPGQVDGRRSVHALAARRKLMEMSKVIASIERLAQQNLYDATDRFTIQRLADITLWHVGVKGFALGTAVFDCRDAYAHVAFKDWAANL